MSAAKPDRQIADLAKNGRERLRVSITEFKGTSFVDVRTFATAADASLIPTPKGVAIRPSMLRPVIDALIEAERMLTADEAHGRRA